MEMACKWRLEDNFQELVLFPLPTGSRTHQSEVGKERALPTVILPVPF